MTLACKFSRRHLDFVLVRSVLHGNIAKHGSDHRNHMFSQTCTCKVTLGDLSRCKKKREGRGARHILHICTIPQNNQSPHVISARTRLNARKAYTLVTLVSISSSDKRVVKAQADETDMLLPHGVRGGHKLCLSSNVANCAPSTWGFEVCSHQYNRPFKRKRGEKIITIV